ncbi:MAG: cyclic nucleotide-binding domain-containing protein [Spirochaetia bacterium]|nr:cyclic nucleotide-binding domain-containing protein [Spirochaetia bacterium]
MSNTSKKKQWCRDLFKQLPADIAELRELLSLPANETVIQKGMENKYIYILLEGEIQVLNEYENGRSFSFAVTQAPGFTGLLEFFAEEKYATSTVETTKPSVFLRMTKSDFRQWVENDFSAYKTAVTYFAKRMYPSISSMGNSGAYTNRHILLNYLFLTYGNDINSKRKYRIPITKEKLA